MSKEDVGRFAEHEESVNAHLFIGIDPGASGAIALLCGKRYLVLDIPYKKVDRIGKTKGGKKRSKSVACYAEIVELLEPISMTRAFICVEEAQIRMGGSWGGGTRHEQGESSSAYTAYKVGMGYGMWLLYFAERMGGDREPHSVPPATWKAHQGLFGKDKSASLDLARELFPRAPLTLKKHEGRAEALLIADYMRRITQGQPKRAP